MPGTSASAPASLEVIRRFVNTLDIEDGTDALATPELLDAWLRDAALLTDDALPSQHDLDDAIALREALRASLAANHDRTGIPVEAVAALNEAADRARLSATITTHDGWIMQPRASGVDEAMGRLLAIVASGMADGAWDRLKICLNDACQWAFYDNSRARSAKWCSMQICGNRAKQLAWRQRMGNRSA